MYMDTSEYGGVSPGLPSIDGPGSSPRSILEEETPEKDERGEGSTENSLSSRC